MRYKKAAQQLRTQLNGQPRTLSGGFWHRKSTYPNQMWLGGIHMASPFYAQWTQFSDAQNTTAWADILLQYDLIESHCRNTTTNLLVHGYDESKVAAWADDITGVVPHVWDRAVGWLRKLPGYLKTLAVGIKAAQDTRGGWWLIMDEPYPGKAGNYIESSATAMFTYSFLEAIRVGYIDRTSYLRTVQKAYTLMTTKFVKQTGAQGTLNWEGTVSYYISMPLAQNDLKGVRPSLWNVSDQWLRLYLASKVLQELVGDEAE